MPQDRGGGVARARAGGPPRASPTPARLMMSDMTRLSRDLGLRIIGAAARMKRQIEDLLEYSRVSRSELRLEPISLVLIVHELLGRLEALERPARSR